MKRQRELPNKINKWRMKERQAFELEATEKTTMLKIQLRMQSLKNHSKREEKLVW